MAIPKREKLPAWIEANVPDELSISTLFRFEVTLQVVDPDDVEAAKAEERNVKRKKITVDILPDLDVDMDILEEQMQDIPAQYSFWSAVYSELRLAVALSERRLKKRRGQAIGTIQRRMEAEKTRISVENQKMLVEMDADLIEADVKLAQAQMLAGKVWHMVKALEMKHEVSRSLIGLKKAEHEKS